MSTVSSISGPIRRWYDLQKRDLPWRRTRDPYRIWLSEVILQQTRVDQGMVYWQRFVDRYPTVSSLAAASEDEVLRLWQGLGYYSRARNLLAAARQVVELHEGAFPATYQGLKALKGVGDYTAAAIGSIAFGIPEPVVDGNVYRVLARAFGISTPIDSTAGRNEFLELARRLLDHEEPGEHNQAMMELGATVCLPRNPRCGVCPLHGICHALREDRIPELPVKAGRTKVRERHFNYLFVPQERQFFLRKRTGKDIWQNMYELPLIETERPATNATLREQLNVLIPEGGQLVQRGTPVVHILSHQRIKAIFWEVKLVRDASPPADWILVNSQELERYAVPRLIERWLQNSPETR